MSFEISLSPLRFGAPIQKTPPGIQTIPSGAGLAGFSDLKALEVFDASIVAEDVFSFSWSAGDLEVAGPVVLIGFDGESHPHSHTSPSEKIAATCKN